jgi:hypothetical protein
MQRQHTGRPGTAVIPAGWAAGHAPVVASATNGTLPDSCAIRRPGLTAGVLNRDTGRKDWPDPAAPHFSGASRLDPVAAPGGGERLQVVADEDITQIRFALVIERDAAPDTQVKDIVTVTGRGAGEYVVVSLGDGSESFGRVLYVTRHLP